MNGSDNNIRMRSNDGRNGRSIIRQVINLMKKEDIKRLHDEASDKYMDDKLLYKY